MVQRSINESPETIIFWRKPLVDDGCEGLVVDPFGDPVPYTVKCRLSHERKFPGNYDPAAVGFSTNLARFILSNWNNPLIEDDTFEAIGKEFRIGAVDILKKFGGIIGFQAPLIEAVTMEAGS